MNTDQEGAFIRHAGKAELYVGGVAFVVMLGVVVLNVALRAFGSGILSTEEVAYLGFSWAVFPVVAWLYRTRGLIGIDFFFGLFPPSVRRILAPFADLLLVLANAWFCWLAWLLASGGFIRKTPVLDIPYFWVHLAPLLSFALITIYSIQHLVGTLRHGEEPEHPHETPL